MLPGCQERHPGKDVGIPQRQLAILDRLDDELLPDQVFENEVAEEFVMRWQGNILLPGKGAVRLPLVDVVCW